jgi:hypothetical protein
MINAVIDAYAALIEAYLDAANFETEGAIEAFEADHPAVVDAFYQREVAKGGANAYVTFIAVSNGR